jgi:hypothetical protein
VTGEADTGLSFSEIRQNRQHHGCLESAFPSIWSIF